MAIDLPGLFNEIQRRGLNVAKFSKKTGIPVDRIYQWKKGNGKPKAEDAKIITEWLNGKSEKLQETKIDDPLPFGGVRVTLLDYIHEIQQQKDFLQELLKENMVKIASNLETVVGKAEGLQFDLISGRNTVLKSLARLEKKPELSLLNESDKLKADLAKRLDEVSRKSGVGK